MSLAFAMESLIYFVLGVGTGAVFLLSLRHMTAAVIDGRSIAGAALFSLARVAAVGILFWIVAHLGAGPLLAMFLGFVVARVLLIKMLRVG